MLKKKSLFLKYMTSVYYRSDSEGCYGGNHGWDNTFESMQVDCQGNAGLQTIYIENMPLLSVLFLI